VTLPVDEREKAHEVQSAKPTNLSVYTSITVLVVGSACSVCAALWLFQGARATAEAHFSRLQDQLIPRIEGRLNSFRVGLYGIQGMHRASKSVEREEFRRFVDTPAVDREFKRAFGFSFVEPLPREELTEFVAATRADGAGAFEVHSVGDRPELDVVKLIEPLNRNPNLPGLDVAPIAVWRDAAEEAVRKGVLVPSEGLVLSRSGPSQRPVYYYPMAVCRNGSESKTTQRRSAALVGWNFAPLRLSEVPAELANGNAGEVRLQIFDGSNDCPRVVCARCRACKPSSCQSTCRHVVSKQGHAGDDHDWFEVCPRSSASQCGHLRMNLVGAFNAARQYGAT